jgi:D-glycero-alpha-D-manno-heptose-7-phosphate kinase
MKESILYGKIDDFASIISESWNYKKKLSDSITNSKIDEAFGHAIKFGAISAKISGAGGGGIMMLVVNPTDRLYIIEKLLNIGYKNLNFIFIKEGCKGWIIK